MKIKYEYSGSMTIQDPILNLNNKIVFKHFYNTVDLIAS